jgi:hypothetical protein
VKVGDLVKTTMWGNGVVLELKRFTGPKKKFVATVLVERIVQNTHIRRITGENLEVISESR